ncbi:SDR family oxidoreductase [Amycolatopsis endophytica]|uniref:NAD(P)-dependent dehydrogenase (Short-subunit alcohol dehydrogenase family) n=1 Tax=Amycolatopsis endophytica TaxID=860233 RepID=A0A853BCC9_9PSEU|nr:SDR family oxidoreductase [Amycolatopsis endophytica]NYI92327.1 NAD(P)-dependent dehydrogenase (short-subunit alcohol dehydrogenase family) [Amycolatopsis endophytica]
MSTPNTDVNPPVPTSGRPIEGAVALVTGANRGLGRHFVRQLLARGAARVYATARHPESVDVPGAVPLRLDVTDDDAVREAAATAGDVTLVVNNAGISRFTDLVTSDLAEIRAEMETNYWGTLAVVRAFAPVLAAGGGGAILNVLSAQSWHPYPGTNGYHAAKAAQWALTNGVRTELAGAGTLVTALHLGAVDTDFSAGYDGPKGDPAEVAGAGLDGIEAGAAEVLADDWSVHVKKSLAEDPTRLYEEIRGGVI